MKGKKAQVTVAIIAGIILLASAATVYKIRKDTITKELTPEIALTIEEVPVEFEPVKFFIQNCIKEVTEQGLRIMAERGGFLEPARYNIVTTSEPTESDAVRMAPNSDYSVPYWFYMKSPNNCIGNCDFIIMPDNGIYLKKADGAPSIERQLEEHINQNLDACVDADALRQQGFEIRKIGDTDTIVTIIPRQVLVLVNYPLEATKQSTIQLEKFFVQMNADIEGMYNLAKEIISLQDRYRFFEKHLLNLIAGYSGIDVDRLPPVDETIVRFGGETRWAMQKVKMDIQSILSSYVPLLQVSKTKNYKYRHHRNELSDALLNTGMLIPVNNDYPNIAASFSFYPNWWPIYFEMDCPSNVCRPESMSSNLMTLIGIQRYSFIYDISYPIRVQLIDDSAFNNQGLVFNFFVEANIRRNKFLDADYVQVPAVDFGSSSLCNQENRVSGEVEIKVTDHEGFSLDGADVIYTCVDQSCQIGSTENGVLSARLPTCLGGIISVVKRGYLGKSEPFNSDIGRRDSLRFKLNPILAKRILVKKKLIEKRSTQSRSYWFPSLRLEELKDNERATISLEKIGESKEEEWHSTAVYYGNQTYLSEILIGPGEYKVTINVALDEQIVIPAKTIERDGEEVDLPRQEIGPPYPSGGLMANYTFSMYNLENSDVIVFHALSPNLYDLPENQRDHEDMKIAMNIEEYSKLYWYGASPRFE